MSETPNTGNSIQETGGIPTLFMTVSASQNVQTPVDKTLSISEMAADAKATGDAINNLGAALEDEISNLAADVVTKEMIDTTLSQTGLVADAGAVMTALAGKANVSVENISVNGKGMDAQSTISLNAGDIPMSGEDDTTVSETVTVINETIASTSDRIDTLETDIENVVKSVNNEIPDENGNVDLTRVPYADNLLSSGSQNSRGTFLVRTTGGEASISDGTARISSIQGNVVHTGFVPESITYTKDGSFTVSIDRDTFVNAALSSNTYTFNYTAAWDPALTTYGITINGEPEDGDSISVVYVKEERGTITASNPQTFVSTGWNLYNMMTGYARVINYSETYGFRVGGAYTAISFSETSDGAQTLLTVTDRNFRLPVDATDGYVFVTGSDSTTEIYMTWSDWTTQANSGNYEVYTQSVVNMSGIMGGTFPYGLLAVGDIRDEINFSNRKAYSRIEVMDYSPENKSIAESTGRAYIYDETKIYLMRESALEITLSEGMGQYTANDHGVEMVTGSEVAPTLSIIYSTDLKNKLERDVLTISQQALNQAQKSQIKENLGFANQSDIRKFISANSLSDLEYRILEIGDSMEDASTCMGYALLNFTNTKIPINGGIASEIISRRESGTYIANILQPNGILVTDYFYSGEHHWGSLGNRTIIPQKVIAEQSSSTIKTLNLGNNCKAFIVYITNAYTCQFCVIAMTNSSGAVSLLEVGTGSSITFDTLTHNKLTFGVGSTARQGYFLIMATTETILNAITLA